MRRFMVGLMVAGGALVAFPPSQAEAQVSAGVVLDRDGLRHFHLALGHVYGVPVQSVSRWHPSWMHADELPVVYLLAREARVSPELIMALREQGWSWLDITYHLGVDPSIYVAHLPGSWGPRGHAYGYWRKPSRHDYRRLNDRRIIDYVNVYFWAHAHRRPVTEIIVIRERVPTWTHYVYAEAPRVRFQEPARAQPVYVQPAPATRPAQPRTSTQAPSAAPSRTAAPSASRTPAPAAGRAPTPAASRAPAPAANRAPNPAANRAPNPAANRAPNPAANRAPAPAASRAPAPAASRAPAPAASRATTPAASRAPAPAASRAPAPAASRAPAPAASRSGAPAANRAPTPAANRAPAPAANRAPAPAASRAPANRTPAPAASRAPATTRPPAQRSGGGSTPPPRPGRGN